MEEKTIAPDQQMSQPPGQLDAAGHWRDRDAGTGSAPLEKQAQQTGTIVAEREHAPPQAGKGDADDIAEETLSTR